MLSPRPHAPTALYITLSLLLLAATPPFRALTAHALAWTLLYAAAAALHHLQHHPPRFAPADPPPLAAPASLAACVLAAAVCARFAAPAGCWGGALWIQALIPAVYFAVRFSRGPRALATAAAASGCALAALAHATRVAGRGGVVLGLLSAGFAGAAYVKLEEMVGEEADVRAVVRMGRDVGRWLAPGFWVAAVGLEGLLGVWFGWQRDGVEGLLMGDASWGMVFAGGVLTAGKWGLVPVLVGRWTGGGLALVDAVGAVLAGAMVLSEMQLVRVAGVLGVGVAVSWWFVSNPAGSASKTAPKSKTVLALCVLAGPVLVTGLYLAAAQLFADQSRWHAAAPVSAPAEPLPPSEHPIPTLMRDAEDRFNAMLKRQSKTLDQAVAEYKRRYNMPPPPHFDKWFAYAQKHNVPIIDDYDTIYHSLRPFWGIPPDVIRRMVREAMGFSEDPGTGTNSFVHAYIRSGVVTTGGQGPDWQKEATAGMLSNFAEWLPDLDLPFNIHDEPRVAMPHDTLTTLLDASAAALSRLASTTPINSFTPLAPADLPLPPPFPRTDFNSFAHQRMWTHATASCPPTTPACAPYDPPPADSPTGLTASPLPFIANTTAASDICHRPSLSTRHGFFDRPNSISLTQRPYPVFSQSKVSSFHDILYPSPWYWADKVPFNATAALPWDAKTPQLYWRGSTTGGYSRNAGWIHHHRQRIIGLLEDPAAPATLLAPAATSPATYTPTQQPRAGLAGAYNAHFSHIGQCDPADCAAQRARFQLASPEPLEAAYAYKLLLDVDGNAFSGRFHAFLRSRAVVVKAAVFREWSDGWIVPWVHYVPVGMDAVEVDEVVAWLLRNDGVARRVGENAAGWAERVLTRGAMETWVFRLLLEWGRVVDGERERIGFE